jgi:hypothetical protein
MFVSNRLNQEVTLETHELPVSGLYPSGRSTGVAKFMSAKYARAGYVRTSLSMSSNHIPSWRPTSLL